MIPRGLSLDSSLFNGNLSLKKKIINSTHERLGLTYALYSCILLIYMDS